MSGAVFIDTRDCADGRVHEHAWYPAFAGLDVVRRTLRTGDVTIEGLEDKVTIERKTLSDWVSTLTTGRERFERELDRMLAFERAIIVVEGNFRDVIDGKYRSRVSPSCLVGSVGSIFARWGVATMFASDALSAGWLARSILLKSAKHLSAPTTPEAA